MRLALLPIAALLLASFPVSAQEPAAPAKPQQHARLLARACDELINSAIKRPYGWAWDDAQVGDSPKPPVRNNLFPVAIAPGTTPAAGLVLLHAAELLGDPRYATAARNVGRGIAATQQGRGNFSATASFGRTSASAKEPASALPDRGPTRAALALLLSLIDGNEKAPQDAVTRAAPRAAQWLLRQQAETGAWPVPHPPGAAPKDATRIVRLDTSDTRDSVLAMLLAYEVLGDAMHRRSAERSLEFLMKVRAGAAADVGAGLWQTACTPSAQPLETLATEFPAGTYSLASRFSMQTLFATWAVLGDAQRLAACDLAAQSLADLMKRADGQWHRRFDAAGVATDSASKKDSVFGDGKEPAPRSDPGLPPTLAAIAAGKELGREKFRERLATGFSPKQHLALTVVALSDVPMTLEYPATAQEAQPFVKQLDERFRLSEGGSSSDLRARVRRLWALYLRARIEKDFGF
jgi:hypothetical protein